MTLVVQYSSITPEYIVICLTISRCSPMLKTFSMSGHTRGLESGVAAIMTGCQTLEELLLRNFPGSSQLGMKICHLQCLRKLHLGNSTLVTEEVGKTMLVGFFSHFFVYSLQFAPRDDNVKCQKYSRFYLNRSFPP